MLVTFKVSVVVAAVVVIIIDVVSGCSVSVVGIIVVGFIVVVVNIVVVRSKTLVVSGSFVVDGLSVVVVVVLQYDDNLRVQTFKFFLLSAADWCAIHVSPEIPVERFSPLILSNNKQIDESSAIPKND